MDVAVLDYQGKKLIVHHVGRRQTAKGKAV